MKSSFLAALLGAVTLPVWAGPPDVIGRFEPARFAGTWYEIAQYTDWPQRHCRSETSARFQLAQGNQFDIVRRCRNADGEIEQTEGLARTLGGPNSARMEATFAAQWLRMVPAVWHDYWIVDIDPQYQMVAISDEQRQNLWILSRAQHADDQDYQALLGRLAARGFDTGKLQITPQP